MANGTDGNLKWMVTTAIACIIAVTSATAFVVNHVSDTGIHQTPLQKKEAVQDTVDEKLAPIEVDIRYIRRDLEDIKQSIKELQHGG